MCRAFRDHRGVSFLIDERLVVNFRGERRRKPPKFGGIFRQIRGERDMLTAIRIRAPAHSRKRGI
jgi:hypothetical protein